MRGDVSKALGLVMDADYPTQLKIDGKKTVCPFYRAWINMCYRVYHEKFHEKEPTYKGCSIEQSWLTFSNFRSWMESQNWEGKQLDKDLLVEGNKHYGPDTCCFISRQLNMFLTTSPGSERRYPVGASWSKKYGRFESRCGVQGKRLFLGMFDTPEEAHFAWQKCKLALCEDFISKEDDERVKIGLIRVLEKISHHINNKLILESL